MAKPNYAFAKRQRDLAKKQKKEQKKQRKVAQQGPTDENTGDTGPDDTSPPTSPGPAGG